MRATINFEVELDRVNETMMELISTQVEYIIDAASLIGSRKSGESGNLLEALTETLEKIDRETAQLRQYRDMLLSFERAKFETILPQPAAQAAVEEKPAPPLGDLVRQIRNAQAEAGSMTQFESFVDRMKEAAAAKGVDVPELCAIEPDQPKKEDTDVEPPSKG
tara:strand:- start:4544 stop:5035 length:492 start_codon:yes stop_codon:yes gene_type:complete